ncbi:MAG: two pore domain potassium channel family protein [Roseovarius sp.]|jgi:voltage-gated potassium channel|nr:two pore domain potassium channel family protein [Roseovarius sp.]
MREPSLRVLLALLMVIIGGATVFFHLVEGWSWIDSYFFTMVTLSTVGYGNLVPATAIGKIATTVLIVAGLGIFAVAVQRFGFYAIRRRELKIHHSRHHSDAGAD